MRVVSLHPDLLLATSAIWQTNCVIVRSDDETFVIDSPILPEELEMLPALLEQLALPGAERPLGTHADSDHLLGRLALLGCDARLRNHHSGAHALRPRGASAANCAPSTRSTM